MFQQKQIVGYQPQPPSQKLICTKPTKNCIRVKFYPSAPPKHERKHGRNILVYATQMLKYEKRQPNPNKKKIHKLQIHQEQNQSWKKITSTEVTLDLPISVHVYFT